MAGRLAGKVAVITGAARGTGAVTARIFVEEGARVVIGDVLDAEGAAVAAGLGAAAEFVHLDVVDPESWQSALARCEQRFGPVDVLVNNAAVFLFRPLDKTDRDAFEHVLRVNVVGSFLGIQACARVMRARRAGAIVNVASTDSLKGRELIVAYATSKWGLRGLTRVAALELGRHGIRVNAVCPEAGSGQFISPYLPEGIDPERVLSAAHQRVATQKQRSHGDRLEDVARMIAFLASDEAASCSGAEFVVDNAATAGDLITGLPGH